MEPAADVSKGPAAERRARLLSSIEPILVPPCVAGHALGVGRTRVFELVKEKRLVARRFGKLLQIEWASVKALAAALPLADDATAITERAVEVRRQRIAAKRAHAA